MKVKDKKYKGENSRTEIGENCTIRENVTVHAGTKLGGALTKIGNSCLIMSGVHIGHDSILHDNVIISSNSALAGHVTVHGMGLTYLSNY